MYIAEYADSHGSLVNSLEDCMVHESNRSVEVPADRKPPKKA